MGNNSLRVRAVASGEIREERAALLEPVCCVGSIKLGEQEAFVRNGKISARLIVNGSHMQIPFLNQDGKVLLQEMPSSGALNLRARRFKALPGDAYCLKASFLPTAGEKIYGMGQYQQTAMDLKGYTLELAQRNSQVSIPFYVSSAGCGFLWNNPAEIEAAYAAVTGKVPMMPEYGLGLWQCKLRYYNQEQALSVAREYKRRGISLDVIIIDYFHWYRCGDWRFDIEAPLSYMPVFLREGRQDYLIGKI